MKNKKELTVHMLICSRDYEMALNSIESFISKSNTKYKIFFHDDSTLKNSERINLERVIPNSKVITKNNLIQTLIF